MDDCIYPWMLLASPSPTLNEKLGIPDMTSPHVRITLERKSSAELVELRAQGALSDEVRTVLDIVLRERGIDPAAPVVPPSVDAKPTPQFEYLNVVMVVFFLFGLGFINILLGRHVINKIKRSNGLLHGLVLAWLLYVLGWLYTVGVVAAMLVPMLMRWFAR